MSEVILFLGHIPYCHNPTVESATLEGGRVGGRAGRGREEGRRTERAVKLANQLVTNKKPFVIFGNFLLSTLFQYMAVVCSQ